MKDNNAHVFVVLIALMLVGLPLFMAIQTFPSSPGHWKEPLAPLQEKTALQNGVVALLSAFRPLDTLGVLLVLLCSLIGVLALGRDENNSVFKHGKPYTSSILSLITGFFFPFCLVFALYLLGYGFSTPGGGIQGGVMLSAAAILFFLTLGAERFEKNFHPKYFLQCITGSLILFVAGFFIVSFTPKSARPSGILPLEIGLLGSVGAILVALFWALAKEED